MNTSFHDSIVNHKISEIVAKISPFFSVYEVQEHEGNIYFFGFPRYGVLHRKLWDIFYENGYQLSVKYELGEHVLIATPLRAKERLWINLLLAIATVFTTMFVGSLLFGADPASNPSQVLKGIPFTIAIMTVLGAHEAGHYLVARVHGMHTSLPYFIPFPSIIGTMGAVIKHRGPIPDRKALFDVGVAGPLIGLIASVVVTVIGLLLPPPIQQTESGIQIQLGIPPLFEFITNLVNNDTYMLHPVAFAGWVGMFVTALNLIPAGQLDGGHMLRAMIGEKASYISTLLPFVLISFGFYITYFQNLNGSLWVFWGFILSLFAAAGHPQPLNDYTPIGKERTLLGAFTFILGILCITPVPFQI